MLKFRFFNQWSWMPCALFLVVGAGMDRFVLGTLGLRYPQFSCLGPGTLLVFTFFLALLTLESLFVFKLEPQETKPFLTSLLATHLPWLLGFLLPFWTKIHLPPPHDFLLRKVQILFGLIWVTHLFLFTGWLLWRLRNSHRRVSTRFGWVAAFLFVGLTFYTTQCDLSGDEPHYLLMAYSLLHDGDLDLTNNYANKDYLSFYHRGDLQPQGLEHVVNGKRYSHHPLGPVLLVLPGFKLAGRLGAALTMALLSALALFWTLRLLEETGSQGMALQWVGTIGLFSSPILLFCGLIFPEIPSACLVALACLLFVKRKWVGLGLALGLLLWMHNRNDLLVIPFLTVTFLEIWKGRTGKWEDLSWLALGLFVPTAALCIYFHSLYGVWTPLGAHNEAFTSLFPFRRFFIGFFGLLLDQECGLWFHFPIFALAVTGGAMLWTGRGPLRMLVPVVFLFYYLFMCFYENLGLTPATRYLVCVTPLLLAALYPALKAMERWNFWSALSGCSFALGVLVNWILAVVPWMRYNPLDGQNWMLKVSGDLLHLPLTTWEPAFQAPVIAWQSYLFSAFWVAAALGWTVLFIRTAGPRTSPKE